MVRKESYLRIVLLLTFSLVFSSGLKAEEGEGKNNTDSSAVSLEEQWSTSAIDRYTCIADTNLSYDAFEAAYKGYYHLMIQGKLKQDKYLTVVDFSVSSSKKRLFVIDMEKDSIIYNTLCAHGKNSGREYATKFSNKSGSHMSSIGFYITSTTYRGKYDLALRLEGQERTNSRARSRGVVMHGAKYANPSFLENYGMLGRSYGCPALPMDIAKPVMNTIKGGSCFFIYYPSNYYLSKSKLLKANPLEVNQNQG